jgi:hypothetical protein
MAVVEIQWNSFTAFNGVPNTMEIDIPPAAVGVQCWLNGVDGGGLVFAGIDSFRRRLSSGADQPVNFNAGFNPPVIFDTVSSVTFALSLGQDQEGWLTSRLDFWA